MNPDEDTNEAESDSDQNERLLKATSSSDHDNVLNEEDNDEDDDEELLAAASSWAAQTEDLPEQAKNEQTGGEKKKKKKRPRNEMDEKTVNPSGNAGTASLKAKTKIGDGFPSRHETRVERGEVNNLSLHLTQLPYHVTEYDIRTTFVAKGCIVTSVRMVMKEKYHDRSDIGKNKNKKGPSPKKFTGVAFVDVADRDSFERALALHRTNFKGRTLNVRPTKTKSELANIVERTKVMLAEQNITKKPPTSSKRPHHAKKKKEKAKDNKKPSPSKGKGAGGEEQTKQRQDTSSSTKRKSHPHNDSTKETKRNKKEGGNSNDGKKKTKAVRARRAAILMSRGGKGRR